MDRITRLHIYNVRAIEALVLDLAPMTVLIGDNGAGKSTVIECLEILRRAASDTFVDQLYQVHGGLPSLLRRGASSLRLGLDVEDTSGGQPPLRYLFELSAQGGVVWITKELLEVRADTSKAPLVALQRSPSGGKVFDQSARAILPVDPALLTADSLLIAAFGKLPPQAAIGRLLDVLRKIEVHLPFFTCAAWAARTVPLPLLGRGSSAVGQAKHQKLDLLGRNLASAWFQLKNKDSAHWDHTLGLVRLGLGDWVDTVITHADGGDQISLSLKATAWDAPIPAASLSDGQLAWLSFIAIARLSPDKSLLAIDEPELHLHPSLLGRVVSLLQDAGDAYGVPVLLSTHSDRVLELLHDPVSALRVCSLDERACVRVRTLDRAMLTRWLEHFNDIGSLRASGYLHKALAEAAEGPSL